MKDIISEKFKILKESTSFDIPWKFNLFDNLFNDREVESITQFKNKSYPTKFVEDTKGNRFRYDFSLGDCAETDTLFELFSDKSVFDHILPKYTKVDDKVLLFAIRMYYDVLPFEIPIHTDMNYDKLFTLQLALDSGVDGTEFYDTEKKYSLTAPFSVGSGYFFTPTLQTHHAVGLHKPVIKPRLSLMCNYYHAPYENYVSRDYASWDKNKLVGIPLEF